MASQKIFENETSRFMIMTVDGDDSYVVLTRETRPAPKGNEKPGPWGKPEQVGAAVGMDIAQAHEFWRR